MAGLAVSKVIAWAPSVRLIFTVNFFITPSSVNVLILFLTAPSDRPIFKPRSPCPALASSFKSLIICLSFSSKCFSRLRFLDAR